MMKPDEYLKRAVTAVPVYKVLWQQAVAILSPIDPPKGSNVECFFSATDLSEALDGARTVSNLRNELAWLQNWGWLKTRRGTSRRFLGRRESGQVFYLLADFAALQATGERRLVSREVLGIQLPDLPEVTEGAVKRMGAARQWAGDASKPDGGASLDALMG